MPVIPLKSLSALPPARTRHQAARDMLAEAERLDGIIRVMEADGTLFLNRQKAAEWRALCDERGRLIENACDLAQAPIERLHVVLFDEAS